MLMKPLRYWAVALSVMTAGAASAQDAVLAQVGTVQVTEQDVLAELQRAPAEARAAAVARPETLQLILRTLMARRLLAQEAQASALGASPAMQAQLALARERTLSDALMQQLDAENEPDEAAVEAYARNRYAAEDKRLTHPAQTRARHILITGEDEQARAEAEKLRQQIEGGASFEEIAHAHSKDPGSAAKGGDLGFFAQGRMVPEFDAALSQLQRPGELSPPVKTQFGWHVIELVERRPAGKRPYEEVRDELRKEARMRILTEKRTAKLSSLVDHIDYRKEAIEAFAQKQK